tara:strand:- start:1257 stop:1475 length:219 start_codon:yes stop_codon:yes gene_type:complete
VKNGDTIKIAVPSNAIDLLMADEQLEELPQVQDNLGWEPIEAPPRTVTVAFQAYARLSTSADKGAVRDLSQL